MIKAKQRTIILLCLAVICLFIISPANCMKSTLNGLHIWLVNVLPALFPFFILTKIIISLNQSPIKILDKFTNKFFNINAGLIYTLSILSGYPVGAKMISNYYELGKIDKTTATDMLSFCSTSGPMFIVGSVGIGIFRSVKIGYILLISHILGSFVNGLIFTRLFKTPSLSTSSHLSLNKVNTQNKISHDLNNNAKSSTSPITTKAKELTTKEFNSQKLFNIPITTDAKGLTLQTIKNIKTFNTSNSLTAKSLTAQKNSSTHSLSTNKSTKISNTTLNDIMYDSIISILMVGGYIVFACVIISLLNNTIFPILSGFLGQLFSINSSAISSVLSGILEITNGILNLSLCPISIKLKVIISSGLIAFSGICIMLQSLGFLNKIGVKKSLIVRQKLTQALVTTVITVFIVLIFL